MPDDSPVNDGNKDSKLFPDAKDGYGTPTWCSLNWIADQLSDDSCFADAFKEAGDKIITELARGEDPRHPDPLFMPVAFLYRHALELKLKILVRKGMALKIVDLPAGDVKNALERHYLDTLWRQFRILAIAHWPDGNTTDLDAAEKTIMDFHRLDISGQNLRYAQDTKGNKTAEKFPDSVELSKFKETFEETYSLLDGCEMDFDNCLAIQSEIESSYDGEYCI